MTALTFEQPGGKVETVILRQPGPQALDQNPHMAEFEYRVLALTRSLGLPAPAPLHFDLSGRIFPHPYLVMEFIAGMPEFSPADPIGYARQMAAALVQIHSADCTRQDCSFLPEISGDFPAASRRQKPAFAEEKIRAILAGAGPIPRRNPPTLLHGDYWPGNVLWQDEKLAAVIDWEDAQRGDPLLDLAISRLDILWIFGADAMQAFTSHYLSSTAIDDNALPYWDLYAALRLARMAGADLEGWAAFFHPYGRTDITAQSILEYYQGFVSQAAGRLP